LFQKTLTVEIEGDGAVGGDIQCSSKCSSILEQDVSVEIIANPSAGYKFHQWNGACSGSGNCQLVMSSDRTVAAVFTEQDSSSETYQLTVSKNGFGSVTSSPAGINCGADCTESYTEDSRVSLTATADTGHIFIGWSGSCGGTSDCVVTMTQALTVTANFQQQSVPDIYELSVVVNGEGTVSSSPGGIDCGSDCSQEYQANTQVSLTATPESGYDFVSWSGACSGNGGCSVSLSSNQSVTALFEQEVTPELFPLSVSVNGSGVITSSPAGISCGSNCTQEFSDGTSVQLIASPSSGFEFVSWSGACSGSSSCSVNMTSAMSVIALFEEQNSGTFQLVTSVVGNGNITSTPTGIECGIDCSESYDADTVVTLIANADLDNSFNGWSGACTGNSSCTVTMDTIKNVTAEFVEDVPEEFTLSVVVDGSGRVTSQPTGIDCESDCSETYQADTQVTITATPDSGFVLDHWQGACSGNGGCSITMDEVKAITAVFAVENNSAILIENYVPQGDAFQLGEIPNNASGITWHSGLQQYLVVRNNAAEVYRYDVNFAYLGQFRVSGISADTEGLAFVGENQVMIVSEDNYASRIEVDEFTSGVDGDVPNSQRYRVMTRGGSNKGLEGVAVRKATNSRPARVYACQEGTGGSNMRIVNFDMPDDSTSLYDYSSNLTVNEPFEADQALSGRARDLAGMLYDSRTDNLILVSQESRVALQIDPETGAIKSSLGLNGAPQFEGVTLGPNNELVFVSEGNWIRIYDLN